VLRFFHCEQVAHAPARILNNLASRVDVFRCNVRRSLPRRRLRHPIVSIVDGDPIALGLVVCLNRPGGSITAYRGSGERPTATTPPTSVMNSRRFISNPAPDVLNPSVSNFPAQVQVVDVRVGSFSSV
jgi:hypothetical protein